MHELEKAVFPSPHPVPLPAGEGTAFLATAGACRDRFFRSPLPRIAGERVGVRGCAPGSFPALRRRPGANLDFIRVQSGRARLRFPSACHPNGSSEYPVTRGLMRGKVRWFSPSPRDNAEVAEMQGWQRPMPDVAADHPGAGGDGRSRRNSGGPSGRGPAGCRRRAALPAASSLFIPCPSCPRRTS